jgi:hypothetical protein
LLRLSVDKSSYHYKSATLKFGLSAGKINRIVPAQQILSQQRVETLHGLRAQCSKAREQYYLNQVQTASNGHVQINFFKQVFTTS